MVSEVILCKYCNTEKDRNEFAEYNLKNCSYWCKDCYSKYQRNYRQTVMKELNENIETDEIECRKCNTFKPSSSFYASKKFYYICAKCYKDKYCKSYKNQLLNSEEAILNYLYTIHKSSTAKRKVHNGETSSMNLSRSEIYELLREQDFKCAITKISFLNHLNPLLRPSIDRIDSNIGYRKENCQIVLRFINLGKNKHSQEELFECLKMIKENCVI